MSKTLTRNLLGIISMMVLFATLAACAAWSKPSQPVIDKSFEQDISIRATEAALRLTPTVIAINDDARHRDLNYQNSVATTTVSVHVFEALGLIVVLAAAILLIGGAVWLLVFLDKRGSLIWRGHGQSPLVMTGTAQQLVLHDHDRSVQPTVVISRPSAIQQFKAGILGQAETPISIQSPVLADPTHQLLVTGQSLKLAMVVGATTNSKGGALVAPSGARELIERAFETPALMAPTDDRPEIKVIRLQAGQDEMIRRMLPKHVDVD